MYAAVALELVLTPGLHDGLALNLALYAVLCSGADLAADACRSPRSPPCCVMTARLLGGAARASPSSATPVIIVVLSAYAVGHEATRAPEVVRASR